MKEKWGWVIQDVYADYHEVQARCYCVNRNSRSTAEMKWRCDPKEHPELLEILDNMRQYIEAHLPELSEEYRMEFTE